jgi:hypothetical protein
MSKKSGPRMTLQEIEEHQRRHGFLPPVVQSATTTPDTQEKPVVGDTVKQGRGIKKQRTPNRTEQRYGDIQEARKRRGDVIEYAYEPFPIRLAEKCVYHIDWVARTSGDVTLDELAKLAKASALEVVGDKGLQDILNRLLNQQPAFEAVEIKGGGPVQEDSKIKFKTARAHNPWAVFSMLQWKNGEFIQIL